MRRDLTPDSRSAAAADMLRAMSSSVKLLNDSLAMELAVMNRYLELTALAKAAGFMGLAGHFEREVVEEMGHAKRLMDRILSLGGNIVAVPADLKVKAPDDFDVVTIFEQDLEIERRAMNDYADRIAVAAAERDFGTRVLFESIYAEEVEASSWNETQLSLIQRLTLPNYLLMQLK